MTKAKEKVKKYRGEREKGVNNAKYYGVAKLLTRTVISIKNSFNQILNFPSLVDKLG